MAAYCALCGNKISALLGVFWLDDRQSKFRLCGSCSTKGESLHRSKRTPAFLNNCKSMIQFVESKESPEKEAVLEYLNGMYDAAKAEIDQSEKEKRDAEREALEAVKMVGEGDNTREAFQKIRAAQKVMKVKPEYKIAGCRGRRIEVYDNRVIITTDVTMGSLLTSNATDGEKTIFYADVIGVQYKEPGVTIGYLQLETPSGQMNNTNSNQFSENTFTFETVTEEIREMKDYILWQISKRKQ